MKKTFVLTINKPIEDELGNIYDNLDVSGGLSGLDLHSSDTVDTIGYKAVPRKDAPARIAGKGAVRIPLLNPIVKAPRQDQETFGGNINSSEFNYVIAQDETTGKSGLSDASMEAFKEVVKTHIATALGIEVADIS